MPTQLDDRQVVNRAALAAIGTATNATLDSVFSAINTIFANATSAPTASVIMKRDANANTQVNNIIENFATTATAAGTTTLTVASAHTQQFTGSTTQTVVLPDATTLFLGHSFLITNRSTGYVTVNKNGGTLVQLMAPGSQTIVTVTNIGSAAGAWDSSYSVAGSIPFLQTNVITDATTTGSAATLQTGDILDGVVRLTNASLVSVSGVPAGASGQFLIIENQTGATITINNDDAGASAANRIFTGTGGAVSMPANSTFAFTYDSTSTHWMLTGGSGSGSGSGSGKNYLSVMTASTASGVPNTGNGNLELGSTTGFSLGTVTLTSAFPSGVPTFGSGASGNLSLSVISSGQLAGAYSLGYVSSAATTAGNFVATNAFFIDEEDKAKVQAFKFYYKAAVNPANGNFSGTSSNSFGVAIWDVTNSAWIQPAGVFNLVQNSGTGICTGTFQTTSNSTQYRLVVYNANASAGAITMYFDDFFVGPQVTAAGAAISDWTAYTPTYVGIGTVSNSNAFWKREGDSLLVVGTVVAGTSTATPVSISLPSGLVADGTKFSTSSTLMGEFQGVASGSATWTQSAAAVGWVFANSSNAVNVNLASASASSTAFAPVNGNSIISSGQTLTFRFRIPIAGWSSNTVMSNDTDTRIVSARYSLLGIVTIPDQTAFKYTTKNWDTHGAYNTSTGGFTVPVTGYYRVTGCFFAGATGAFAYVAKNSTSSTVGTSGNQARLSPSSTSQLAGVPTSTTVFANAGDVLYMAGASGITITNDDSSYSYVEFERISGPATIAASESVGFVGSGATSNAAGSNTLVQFSTIEQDTHSGWNSTNKTWTCPVSGTYLITAQVNMATGSTATVNQFVGTLININAVNKRNAYKYVESTGVFNWTPVVTYQVKLLAGQTVSLVADTNITSPSLSTGTSNTYMQIAKVGN